MKKQKKWKPGGRSRQKSVTKKWLLKQNERLENKDVEVLTSPVVPRNSKKEV